MYSRAYLSRIGAPVVALCSMAVATGVNTREFRGADTANHDQYTGFDRFAEPMAKSGRAGDVAEGQGRPAD